MDEGSGASMPQMSQEQIQQNEARAKQEEQERQRLLGRILHKDALARIANIAAANPRKARKLEDNIITSARQGQILEQVTEKDLIKMATAVKASGEGRQRIRFERRKTLLDTAGTDPEYARRLGVDITGWNDAFSGENSESQYSDISVPDEDGKGGGAGAGDDDDDEQSGYDY
mmetsp:Transcript_4683/g.8994  ORF Transcript_4683/g.8994 Transcript_4683/m.8994 type:complete len:173 (-) Transcript_4683:14-532(-)